MHQVGRQPPTTTESEGFARLSLRAHRMRKPLAGSGMPKQTCFAPVRFSGMSTLVRTTATNIPCQRDNVCCVLTCPNELGTERIPELLAASSWEKNNGRSRPTTPEIHQTRFALSQDFVDRSQKPQSCRPSARATVLCWPAGAFLKVPGTRRR